MTTRIVQSNKAELSFGNPHPPRPMSFSVAIRCASSRLFSDFSSPDVFFADHRAEASRILVVEDEAKVARASQEGLEREEYDVVVARMGEEGFFLVSAKEFDLVILDIVLPGRDGLQGLSTLRKRGLVTAVLHCQGSRRNRRSGAGMGGGVDDYIVKPFAFPEFSARIRALLRRGRTDQFVRLKLADLEMDPVARKVKRGSSSAASVYALPC